MGIRHADLHATVAIVSCQRCSIEIIVPAWRDAAKHGWAVPSDGHFQMCPECLPKHKEELLKHAIRVEE